VSVDWLQRPVTVGERENGRLQNAYRSCSRQSVRSICPIHGLLRTKNIVKFQYTWIFFYLLPAKDIYMQRLRQFVRIFVRNEDGPTAVEYAVMLALIVLVCFTAVKTLGTNTSTTYTHMSGSLAGGS
jgi:pilus assembly protein Flp/PilA